MASEGTPPILLNDPLIGKSVGEYQVLEAIGEGGMGVVYRGIQPVIKKRVAIKVLKPQVADDGHQVQRLIAEAESVNAIGHRGIVDIFGLGSLEDGRPYIIMEFLDGEALDLWLQQQPGGRVPLLTALELLLEICAPLGAAHRANVIHRDLKPSNVFVCRQTDGSRFLKLLDFGLAKKAVGIDGNTKQTSQGVVSGTPDYMAPEQARGLSISPRSDIYALGVLAFELFTGQVPFSGATPMDVMVAHVSTPPPAPRALNPELPTSLDQLVLRMLSKAPDARPQTVDEVRMALEDAVMELGAPRPRSSREHAAFVPTEQTSPGLKLSALTTLPATPAVPVAAMPSPGLFGDVPELTASGVKRVERKRIGLFVSLAAVLGVGGAGAVWFFTRPPPPEPVKPVEPVTPAKPVEPVVVVDAGPPTPVEPPKVDAGVAVAEAPDAGAAEEPEAKPDAGVNVKKQPPPPPPATQKQLKDRIAKLEARAKKKPNLDPTALQFLSRYRIDTTTADTPAKRLKVQRQLDEWERNFLKK